MISATTQERVTIPGARGRLAGLLAYPDGSARGAALVCNAHPLMGGSMANNVTRSVGEGLAGAGFVTLQFDYLGVGESEGERLDVSGAMATFWATGQTEADPEMLDDALAARRWFEVATGQHAALVGYSFGAWVASEIADDRTRALCLLAPTVERHDFSSALSSEAPLLLVTCTNDFATRTVDPATRFAARHGTTEHVCIDTDHFFRKREDAIVEACAAFLRREVIE